LVVVDEPLTARREDQVSYDFDPNEHPTRQLLDAFAKAALEAQDQSRFPVEPPDGAVLRYQKTFPNSTQVYTYVALRAGGKWYRTGKDTRVVNWPALV
jgi:hypothetical protein